MIAFLAMMGVVGAAVGGYAVMSKKEKESKSLSDSTKKKASKVNMQGWVFPKANKSDKHYAISEILLLLMPTEDEVPEEWMNHVRRYEGNDINSEAIHKSFWENFLEMNEKYRQFEGDLDEFIRLEDTLNEQSAYYYKVSMHHLKTEIYELGYACYQLMEANEEEIEETEEMVAEVPVNEVDEDYPLSIEEQKLMNVYRSKDSTPEMKKNALALLQELQELNPHEQDNSKRADMETDIETIRRIVSGKKL